MTHHDDTLKEMAETGVSARPGPEEKPKPLRGFAKMSRERVVELARRGGAAVVASGRQRRFTPEQAAEAGRKGGFATAKARRGREKNDAVSEAPRGPSEGESGKVGESGRETDK